MIFVLTGNGKGKTTCALGMGVRAVGAGRKVLLVQFLKSGRSAENKVLQKIGGFEVKSFGRDVCITKKNVSEQDFELTKQGFEFAKKSLSEGDCDFLMLDEICVALHFGLLNKKEVLRFLQKFGKKNDIVLTGRYCPKETMKMADLITEFREIKHYYRKGKRARRGIEY